MRKELLKNIEINKFKYKASENKLYLKSKSYI